MKIAYRITLWVLIASLAVMVPMAYFSYLSFFSGLRKQFAAIQPLFSQSIEMNIVRQNTAIETITRLATYEILAGSHRTPEEYKKFFALCVQENNAIFGISLVITPEENPDMQVAWYLRRNPSDMQEPLVWINLIEDEELPHFSEREWYLIPKEKRTSHWSKPYIGRHSGIPMVTYSAPLIEEDGRFLGVIACDVTLGWIETYFKDIHVPNADLEQMFLLAKDGTVLADKQWGMRHENIFEFAKRNEDSVLEAIARKMVAGEIGEADYRSPDRKNNGRLIYLPVDEHDGDGSPDWSLGIFVPFESMRGQAFMVGRTQVLIGFCGMVMLVLAFLFVARGISRPISELEQATLEIAAGNLDVKLPKMLYHDEVSQLAESFARMQDDLKTHIESLAKTTREKEHMASELHIARRIQMNQLPRHLPDTPYLDRFDLAACMEPAREVGGDFYDYLMLNDETICLVLADVSGKGVPASLLMARSSALFRSSMINGRTLGDALEHVNIELCIDNDENMFVTLFALTVNLSTGECHYANAGHNPAFIIRKNQRPQLDCYAGNIPLGIEEDTHYTEETFQLEPGELVFLYTDGVSEALDTESHLFGEKGAEKILTTADGRPCEEIIASVLDGIRKFACGTPQSDDITMLAIRWNG